MYALVHKDQVLSGPRSWNSAFFQSILKNNKIENEKPLPKSPTETLPYHIDLDTRIMLVEEYQEEILDSLVQYSRGPLWELKSDVAIARYEAVDTPLDFAKDNLKQIVASKRYDKESEGIKVTIQDLEVTIDTSRGVRSIFVEKYLLSDDSTVINWKFPESWLNINKTELGLIVNQIDSYIQSCFNWEKEINDEIDETTTKEDLLRIKNEIV